MVTNKEKLHKPEGLILLELKESRSATCLGLEIKYCLFATKECEVFVKSETVSLETVPITKELMQNEVPGSARDFGSKCFLVLKDKDLVVAT